MNIHVPFQAADSRPLGRYDQIDQPTETALARAWRERGDRGARDRLILAHRRLAQGAVARMAGRSGENHDDLMQQAYLGLMKAADRFDPDKGVRFSTYARWWIRAEIQEYRVRNWAMVQIGSSAAQKMIYLHLRRLESRHGLTHGEQPNDAQINAELSRIMQLPEKRIATLRERMSVRDVSLDQRPDEDSEDGEALDIVDENAPDPEVQALDSLSREKLRTHLAGYLDRLPSRERAIVTDYYVSDPPRTLSELAEIHAVSRERIRQIREQGMRKLRRWFAEDGFAVEDEAGAVPVG
ncbi:MAG: RNA polymerase sigma-32 factor [Saliniramus fredricksonii]|uniref:RNA polymerase sigma-32 factor n=1 Tax=Saliniramus fredricksonii TaxID=1653334 RepID=A0A0P7X906_9HYPH|nr:sigma-70 family RNA polymerase sigma factor [Saliniramus fredricksonii]KPQ11678.1 MAG: RNA polymerase sigma-32 factor [Saliniramus fredricksonii]SCC80251.1 RNA polymerase sigma-32 factor [Saliniramus fredricksonii]